MELNILIAECLKRNAKAERELYYLYAKRIFGICRRYTTDRAQAQDYLQESMTKVFKNLATYDASKSAFSTWVSSITVYTILSDKNKKRIVLDQLSTPMENLRDQSSRYELREEISHGVSVEELLSAIRKLPKDYRNIINLYVFENWSHADIATILNIEPSSSRSKLTRAKAKLKTILTSKSLNSNHEEVA